MKRLTLRQEILGWEAVGRVDLPKGYCSGALVATDLVLTAAHCLIDKKTGDRVDPRDVTFRAGLRDGVAIAERAGIRAVLHPNYDPDDADSLRRLVSDVALVQLSHPIPAGHAAPFVASGGMSSGQSVSLVSYAQGRDKALSWQRDCSIRWIGRGAMELSCDATFGASGAPVFDVSSGRARIVAVVSRGSNKGSKSTVLGMEIAKPLAEVKRALRAGQGVWPPESFEPRRLGQAPSPQAGRADIGARFVRP